MGNIEKTENNLEFYLEKIIKGVLIESIQNIVLDIQREVDFLLSEHQSLHDIFNYFERRKKSKKIENCNKVISDLERLNAEITKIRIEGVLKNKTEIANYLVEQKETLFDSMIILLKMLLNPGQRNIYSWIVPGKDIHEVPRKSFPSIDSDSLIKEIEQRLAIYLVNSGSEGFILTE